MRIDATTRAIVTGPSRGIGRAIAGALAARGATLGLLSRSAEDLEAVARELPGTHHVLPCDVGERSQVARAVEEFVGVAGGLDLVVANAGVAHYGPFLDQPLDAVERMTRVNWLGTAYTVHAALPYLIDRARGHVVVISSGTALRGFPWAAAYGATKAAQRSFAEALRHELSGSGVSVTAVYPGEVASSLHKEDRGRMPDWHRGDDAPPPDRLAAAIVRGVEKDERAVYHPPLVRLLGAVHGVSPWAADRLLRRVRGGTAAPRVD